MSATPSMPGRWRITAWIGVLLLAALLRLPNLTAAWPYQNYVDEGHLLHRVIHLAASGSWDPGRYLYPTLPIYAIRAGCLIAAPWIGPLEVVRPFAYDLIEPPGILLVGRGLCLLVSLGIVVAVGRLAGRLVAPRAALLAALVAAVLPALVLRGALATVDGWATLFVLLVLLELPRLGGPEAGHPESDHLGVVRAGAFVGLAFASKYTAGLVGLAAAVAIASPRHPIGRRLTRLALLTASAATAAFVAMPPLLLESRAVLADLRTQAEFYAGMARGSYWRQALIRAEWDLPFEGPELGVVLVVAALAGTLALARRRAGRAALLPWAVWIAPLLLLLGRYPMRPFRNLLPLAALVPIGVAALVEAAASRTRHPARVYVLAALALLALHLPPLVSWGLDRSRAEDSRALAVDRLVDEGAPDEVVVVLRELAILPSELARLPGPVDVVRWPAAERLAASGRPDVVVAGRIEPPDGPAFDAETSSALGGYDLEARFGTEPTVPLRSWWRGNDEIVTIHRRAPAAEPEPSAR